MEALTYLVGIEATRDVEEQEVSAVRSLLHQAKSYSNPSLIDEPNM